MDKTGKYLIFAWQVGQQKGGIHDMIGTVDRLDEQSIERVIKHAMHDGRIDKYVDNIQVVDRVTMSFIKHKNIPLFYEYVTVSSPNDTTTYLSAFRESLFEAPTRA